MSQIQLKAKDDKYEVIAGLDRPLGTFFISVFVKQSDLSEEDIPPVEFKHQWKSNEVVQKLVEYCEPCERLDKVIKCIQLDVDPADYI